MNVNLLADRTAANPARVAVAFVSTPAAPTKLFSDVASAGRNARSIAVARAAGTVALVAAAAYAVSRALRFELFPADEKLPFSCSLD